MEETENWVTDEPHTQRNSHLWGFFFYNISFLKYYFGNGTLGLENSGKISKSKKKVTTAYFF